jgi:hypothetical protein
MRIGRMRGYQTMDRCVNCRLPCDGTYCTICRDQRECERCSRRLPPRLFTQRDDVCNICVRKSQQPRVRTAVDRIVEEHEIPVADNAGDLHVFLDEHEDAVLRTLVDAVDRHRSVN